MAVLKNQRHERFCQEIVAGVSVLDAAEHMAIPIREPTKRRPPQQYYVYLLIDPRSHSPFYVGKGKGARCFQHFRDFLKGLCKNHRKKRKIAEIYNTGLRPQPLIFDEGVAERDAHDLERSLIQGIGLDILTNVVSGITLKKAKMRILDRVLANIARIKPFESWVRERPRSDADIDGYWFVASGFARLAKGLADGDFDDNGRA
jgi:hypothetical protein